MTDEPYDAETVHVEPAQLGGPVDPPNVRPTLYARVVQGEAQERAPIVPAEFRNRDQRRQAIRGAVSTAGYHAAFHSVRSPKYLAKVALWSPVGVVRALWRIAAWTFDWESFKIRQDAATRNQVDDYLRLSKQRDARVSRRLWVTGPCVALAAILLAVLVLAGPWWLQAAVALVAAPLLAWVGRPIDKPITDRVVIAPGFTRLTAEMVRQALLDIGVIKEAGAITFPPPGIHTDGPGYLARFNLPAGMEAVKIINQRGALSSALRLPIDQVWPSAGPEHAGQIDLWVGKMPSSKMGSPRWALAAPSARVDVFKGYPVGHDERLRPVLLRPFERNMIVGGQPGAGKTSGGRSVVLGGLLDPSVEVWLAAFKAAEDFYDVSPYCTRYMCGLDQVTMSEAEQMVADGLAEVQRRQAVLGRLKRAGRITDSKTNRDLADTAHLGLHPLFIVLDEAHELFLESKEAVANLIRLLKQGRSVFVFCVIITQVASKDSVPPEITRVVSSRWCMSVLDQVANDQIMGTGSYKRGISGTAYRPEIDAGWGVTSGFHGSYVGPVRAYNPTGKDLAAILRRIEQVRAGATNTTSADTTPRRDVLDDVIRVFAHVGRPGVHWERLAELLAQQFPEAYRGTGKDAISALLRDKGVPSVDVKDAAGRTLKGCRLTEVEAAIARREITDGE